MSDGGKGSKPRPLSVSLEVYDDNFKTIFGESKLERKKREEALKLMVEFSEEHGLYDIEENPLVKK